MRRTRAVALVAPILVLLVAVGTPAPLPAQEAATHATHVTARDGWFGQDKVQHFAVSAAITTMGYGGARTVLERDASVGVAVAVAAVAGVLREAYDHRRGRPFSFRDLLWDALGVAAGYLWIREIE